MPKSHSGFSGLITPPEPLPDEDDTSPGKTAAITELPAPPPEPQSSERPASRASTPSTRTPKRQPDREAPPTPVSAGHVALTVRLHEPAARALNDAWLDERRQVNAKLSYPQFASEVVMLGLAAFERRAKQT